MLVLFGLMSLQNYCMIDPDENLSMMPECFFSRRRILGESNSDIMGPLLIGAVT